MFRFTCHPDGGKKFEVVALSRAIAAWERAPGQPKGSRRTLGNLKDLQMSDYVDMAWFAASRSGETDLDIKSWREQVDVELEKYGDDEDETDGDDDEEGPTHVTP